MRRVGGAVALAILLALSGCLGALGTLPSGHGRPRGCPSSVGYYDRPGFHRQFTAGFESGGSMNGFVAVHEYDTLVGATKLLGFHSIAADGFVIPLAGHPAGLHTYTLDAYVDTHLDGHYDAGDAACGMAQRVTVLLPTWGRLANVTATATPATPNATSRRRYAATAARSMTIREVALGGSTNAVDDPGNVSVRVVAADGSVTNATSVVERTADPRLVVGRFAHPVRVTVGARVVVVHRAPNPSSARPVRATLVVNPHGRAFAVNTTLRLPANSNAS